MKKKEKKKIEKNLLFDEGMPKKKEEEDPEEDKKLYPHLRSRAYVYFIHDTNPYTEKELNPFLSISNILFQS